MTVSGDIHSASSARTVSQNGVVLLVTITRPSTLASNNGPRPLWSRRPSRLSEGETMIVRSFMRSVRNRFAAATKLGFDAGQEGILFGRRHVYGWVVCPVIKDRRDRFAYLRTLGL